MNQFREYPKMRYHRATGAMKIVQNRQQEEALGPEWGDHGPNVAPKPLVPAGNTGGPCPSCLTLANEMAAMKAKFDGKWSERESDYAREYATLQEQYNQLFSEHCALKQQWEAAQSAEPEQVPVSEAAEAPRRKARK